VPESVPRVQTFSGTAVDERREDAWVPFPSAPAAPLLWEQQCRLPLAASARVGELVRYARPGGSFVSVNVGYAPHTAADVRALARAWRAQLDVEDQLLPAATVEDVDRARRHGQVAVAFDLEDCAPCRLTSSGSRSSTTSGSGPWYRPTTSPTVLGVAASTSATRA